MSWIAALQDSVPLCAMRIFTLPPHRIHALPLPNGHLRIFSDLGLAHSDALDKLSIWPERPEPSTAKLSRFVFPNSIF
jgi:hypothetical protein